MESNIKKILKKKKNLLNAKFFTDLQGKTF